MMGRTGLRRETTRLRNRAPAVLHCDGSRGAEWGAYTVDEAAIRHGAGVEQETTDATDAYARFGQGGLTGYGEGWLPG